MLQQALPPKGSPRTRLAEFLAKNAIEDIAMSSADDEFGEEAEPAPPVNREQFFEWRSPRFGAANPEPLSNPVWSWLVHARLKAWEADRRFAAQEPEGPCWCFDRFGQSATELPDGRTIYVAGVHEDPSDPGFHRYNDVVVRHPDDRCEIFGYPRDATRRRSSKARAAAASS
ncbi:hypothetical protein [Nannocystis bainbridge]|uniref:Uncharacterized protein n=1 Tax=Nannocystis bainbridge TaxID=2995303 RepID=A0ABT5E8L1_9BACT|nr:hypothetical protein [Nannocystis bainbridge]MDC0721783.1 hypothetical protein [Nannocystis bainbridge]